MGHMHMAYNIDGPVLILSNIYASLQRTPPRATQSVSETSGEPGDVRVGRERCGERGAWVPRDLVKPIHQ